jgi:DNA (cytosine-5)-methyltransferase 1
VHEYNFPHTTIFCRSVTDIRGADIRDRLQLGDRDIDVVFGGPPCQGFSLIGKRALDDERNQLVFHFLRVIDELRPKYFVMENVKGMVTGKHKRVITEIIQLVAKLGYQVTDPYQVLNACHYGVPQDRERLFLLGARQDCDLAAYPTPQTQPVQTKRKLPPTLRDLPPTPTVAEALFDLPDADQIPVLWDQDWVEVDLKPPSHYASILRGEQVDPADYAYPRQWDARRMTSSLRTKHTPTSIARFLNTIPGQVEPVSRFLKLDPNGICNTLRAGTPSSRGAFTSPRPIHPIVPRCITVREAARLHSYPDWFRFHVTKWHGCRQIGNSVPPYLARAVAAEILKVLQLQPAKPSTHLALAASHLLSFTMSQAASYYSVPKDTIPQRDRAAIPEPTQIPVSGSPVR